MSILYNGTTTKTEHTTANIYPAGNAYSILTWMYLNGLGEGGVGRIFGLPEAATVVAFSTENTNSRLSLLHTWSGANATWRSPVSSITTGRWFCVATTYDGGSTANDPLFYIRDTNTDKQLVSVTVTESTAPSGTINTPATGYGVGNTANQQRTMDGRMAYFQFWGRVLTLAELNMAMMFPGTVGRLSLFLPLIKDGVDWSGGRWNATETATAIGDGPPCSPPFAPRRRGWRGSFVVSGGTTYNASMSGTLTSAGALVRQPAKIFSGTLASAGALSRESSKLFAGTLTSAGALSRLVSKFQVGTLTLAGSLSNQASKFMTGTMASAGSLVNQAQKVFTGTLSSSGTLSRLTSKLMDGTLTSGGVLSTIKAAIISLSGTLGFSGTLSRSTSKNMDGTLSSSGDLSRAIGKFFSGTLTSSGSLAISRLIALVVSGTLTMSGSLSRATSKFMAGTLTSAGTLNKQLQRLLGGVLGFLGSLTTSTTLAESVVGSTGMVQEVASAVAFVSSDEYTARPSSDEYTAEVI